MPGTGFIVRRSRLRGFEEEIKIFFCPQCGWMLNEQGKCSKCKKTLKDYWKQADSTFYCPVCKKELNKLGPYCARCGSKIVSYKCPHCNENIVKVGEYCPLCGEKID
jgi:predicted amidophosphoribosyltransferase